MADTSPLDTDRNHLLEFLKDTTSFLDRLVTEKVDSKQQLLFRAQYHEDLDGAWKEFQANWDLSLAKKAIERTDDKALRAAGLHGAQLRLKLRLIRDLKDIFYRTGGTGVLRRLFKAVDNLLGSLGAVAGVDHALEEIKDLLNDLLVDRRRRQGLFDR